MSQLRPKLNVNAPRFKPKNLNTTDNDDCLMQSNIFTNFNITDKISKLSIYDNLFHHFERNIDSHTDIDINENNRNPDSDYINNLSINNPQEIKKDLTKRNLPFNINCNSDKCEEIYEITTFTLNEEVIEKIKNSNYFKRCDKIKNSILNNLNSNYFSYFNFNELNYAKSIYSEHIDTEIECQICLDFITKEKKFGLLLNCDHSFCFSCIKDFRDHNLIYKKENFSICPVCKNESIFVIPSEFYVENKEAKLKLIQENKKVFCKILCEYKTKEKCPFSLSCFFKHS